MMKKGEKMEIDSADASAQLEMNYQALLENTGISIVIINTDGQCIFANSTAAGPLGCDVQDVIGKMIADFLPPEIAQKYLVRNRQLIQSGKGEVYEATFDLPSGTRTFLINDQVLKDDQGNGFAIQSSSIDITERKEAETILAEKEQEYRLLIQNLPGTTVFLFNHDLRFILVEGYVNPEFGFTTKSLLGKTLWEILPEERAKQLSGIYYKTLEGQSTENYISEFKGKSYRVNFVPVKNNQDKIIAGLVVSMDITDIKKAENALLESEQRYRLLFENATDAFLLTNPSEGITYSANPAACAMFGQTEEEITRDGRESIIDLTDPRLPLAMEERRRTGKFSGELTGLRKGGTKFPIELSSTIFSDNKGNLRSSIIIKDISARKEAEDIIRKSEEKWHLLVETIPDYIALYDADGKYLFLNHFAEGFSAKDCEGKTYTEFLAEESKKLHEETFRKAKETKETQYIEYTAFGDNYTIRNYESFFVPIFENDVFVNMLVIARDITQRKDAERLLVESEANARAIMESTDDVLMLIDKNGIMLDCNEAHSKRIGLSRKELIGKNVFDFLPPDVSKRRSEFIDQVLSSGKPYQGEDFRDGLWNEFKIHPVMIGNEISNNVAVFSKDITDRKLAEESLKNREAFLQELNATKDKFFSIIAHDLKSPFNSIIGFSNLLSRQVNERDYEGIKKYATIIQDSSQQALDLLLNLLEWSQSQTGRMVFTPEDVDVAVLISQSVEVLLGAAQQKQISVHKQMPACLVARADKAMINTILRNLISNAIKFTNPGGSIVISAERTAEELVISVADDGVGIRKESIDKLFRIEETHSTLGTQKEKGTGLGLLLCKEFVEKHGGRIGVESELGKGSTFRFSIPLKKEI